MSSPRPLPAHAASASKLLHCSHYSTHPSIMADSTLRMPSTRPIDRRWDRSRGIFFDSVRPRLIQDFTWSASDGVVFSQSPATKRGYAARKLFGSSTSPAESTPPMVQVPQLKMVGRHVPPAKTAAKAVPRKQEYMEPHKVSSRVVASTDNVLQQLAQERGEHERTKELFALQMKQLRHDHQVLLENAERRAGEEALGDVPRREAAVHAQEAALEQQKREHQRQLRQDKERFEAKDDDIARKSLHLDARQNEIEARHTQMDTTIAQIRQAEKERAEAAAQQSVAEEMERLQTMATRLQYQTDRAKREEEEASAVREEYDEATRSNTRLFSDEVDDQVRLYKESIDQSNAEMVERMREADSGRAYRLTVERRDYNTYHALWDDLGKSTGSLVEQLFFVTGNLHTRAKTWEKLVSSFNAEEIHRWFPVKYPALTKQYYDFLKGRARDEDKRLGDIRLSKELVKIERRSLDRTAHRSRRLTRYHRFQQSPSRYSTMHMQMHAQHESPLRFYLDRLDRDIDELRSRLYDAAVDDVTKAGLVSKYESLKSQRRRPSDYLSFAINLRESEALRALQGDSTVMKEIFVNTFEAEKARNDAHQQWRGFVAQNPSVEEGSDLTADQQNLDREDFKRRNRSVAEELEGYALFVRQMRLLEASLGRAGKAGDVVHGYDAFIDKELAQAEVDLLGSPAKLTRRERIFASPARLPTLATPPQTPTRMAGFEKAGLEKRLRELNEMRKNLDLSMNEDERAKNAKEVWDIKARLYRDQIAIHTNQKAEALRRSPPDHVKAAASQNVVDKLTVKVAEMSSSDATLSTAPVEKKLPDIWRIPRPGRARILRSKNSKSPTSKAASSTSGPSASSTTIGGTLTLRPTASKQSSHRFWSSNACDNPQSSATWLEALHKTWPAISARADEETERSVRSDVASSADSSPSLPSTPTHSLDTDKDYIPSMHPIDMSCQADSSQASVASGSSLSGGSSDGRSSEFIHHAGDDGRDDPNLTYHIPPEDYRNAVVASPSTMAAYYHFKLYKGPKGKPPQVFYCTKLEAAEARAREFLCERILGVDLEWESYATLSKSGIKQNVSLIQLAAEDKIALFHISLFSGDDAEQLMPPSLRKILESADYIKTGVNISGDATRLRRCFHVEMRGQFELSHLYRLVQYSESKPESVTRQLVKLASQVQHILGLPLKKDDVRTSAWSKPLNVEQSDYAATDAYAGLRLYHALEAERKKMRPMPPRPAFHEEGKPIVLPNGQPARSIPKASAKQKKQVATDAGEIDEAEGGAGEVPEAYDDQSEEYFDAVDRIEADLEDALQESSQTSDFASPITSLSLASQDTQQTSALGAASASPLEANSSNVKGSKRAQPAPSDELDRANAWVTAMRTPLSVGHSLQAGPAQLRAYYLWHEESLECGQVAGILSVAVQTVAGYILDVLRLDNLSFNRERAGEVRDLLPKSVRWRYRGLF